MVVIKILRFPPLANDQTLQGIDMKKQSASEVRLLAESFGIRCGRLAWSEKSDHKGQVHSRCHSDWLELDKSDHVADAKAGSWLCVGDCLRMVRITMAVPRISTSNSSDVRMRSPSFW